MLSGRYPLLHAAGSLYSNGARRPNGSGCHRQEILADPGAVPEDRAPAIGLGAGERRPVGMEDAAAAEDLVAVARRTEEPDCPTAWDPAPDRPDIERPPMIGDEICAGLDAGRDSVKNEALQRRPFSGKRMKATSCGLAPVVRNAPIINSRSCSGCREGSTRPGMDRRTLQDLRTGPRAICRQMP